MLDPGAGLTMDRVRPVTATERESRDVPRPSWAVVVGLLVAGCALLAAGLVAVSRGSASPPPARRLASFRLPRLVDGHVSGRGVVRFPLTGADRGHPAILFFFSSSCAPCRRWLPTAASVAHYQQTVGSPVVAIGVDVGDPPTRGSGLVAASGVTFAVAADPHDAVGRQLRLTGLPSTVAVAADGRVVSTMTGPISPAALDIVYYWLAATAGTGH